MGLPRVSPAQEQRSPHAGRSPAGSPGSMEGPRGTHSTPSAGLGRTEGSGRRPGLVMAAPWAERNGGPRLRPGSAPPRSRWPTASAPGGSTSAGSAPCAARAWRRWASVAKVPPASRVAPPQGPGLCGPGGPAPPCGQARRSGVGGGEVGAGHLRAAPCVQRWAGWRDAEKLVPIVPGSGRGARGCSCLSPRAPKRSGK